MQDDDTVRQSQTSQVSILSAGMRALVYQFQALYLRTPVKLFRPLRFDYLAHVRAVATRHGNLDTKPYLFWTHSLIGMLVNVLRKEGWQFIPEKVLPPLIANLATGVILYATYLTTLDHFSKDRIKRTREAKNKPPPEELVYWSAYRDKIASRDGLLKQPLPPPSPTSTPPIEPSLLTQTTRSRAQKIIDTHPLFADTFRAGFLAGAVQLLAAAPVDAIYTRLTVAEVLSGNHNNLWSYGLSKLREIGLVGVFAGYSFLLVKDLLGFAVYFLTFEVIKTQGYALTYRMISAYRNFRWASGPHMNPKTVENEQAKLTKVLKTLFVLLAGASAALMLLAVQYPIDKVHKIHLLRLEILDVYLAATLGKRPFIKLYYNLYLETYHQLVKYRQRLGLGWGGFLYNGFFRNAVTTIPATSVALLVFEMMRTELGDKLEQELLLEA